LVRPRSAAAIQNQLTEEHFSKRACKLVNMQPVLFFCTAAHFPGALRAAAYPPNYLSGWIINFCRVLKRTLIGMRIKSSSSACEVAHVSGLMPCQYESLLTLIGNWSHAFHRKSLTLIFHLSFHMRGASLTHSRHLNENRVLYKGIEIFEWDLWN
jgi:hypothetical protein